MIYWLYYYLFIQMFYSFIANHFSLSLFLYLSVAWIRFGYGYGYGYGSVFGR